MQILSKLKGNAPYLKKWTIHGQCGSIFCSYPLSSDTFISSLLFKIGVAFTHKKYLFFNTVLSILSLLPEDSEIPMIQRKSSKITSQSICQTGNWRRTFFSPKIARRQWTLARKQETSCQGWEISFQVRNERMCLSRNFFPDLTLLDFIGRG